MEFVNCIILLVIYQTTFGVVQRGKSSNFFFLTKLFATYFSKKLHYCKSSLFNIIVQGRNFNLPHLFNTKKLRNFVLAYSNTYYRK